MSIAGNLRTMPFPDLLQWVSQSRKSGTLAIEGEPFAKRLYFRDGLVIAAASGNPKEFLGYYLVGWGFVGDAELQELLDMQDRHGTMLGELLVIIGRLSRSELAQVLQLKTEDAVHELFLREEGDFQFHEGVLPTRKLQPLDLPADMLIMEGVRRRDETLRSRELIPDDTWIPRLVRAVNVQDLTPAEHVILREINGVNTIEEVALASRSSLFDARQFVYLGLEQKLFEILPPPEGERSIPGYSRTSWRALLKNAEHALDHGDLLSAHRSLAQLREKHADRTDVLELAGELQQRIDDQIAQRELSDSLVLELAIPPADLVKLPCTPTEGFLLSRINGIYTLGEITNMVPSPPAEVRLIVDAFMREEVVRLKAPTALRPTDH